MQKTNDVDRFFEVIDNKRIFKGDILVVRVLKRFEKYGLLNISDKVTSLGIMSMEIDNKYIAYLHLLAEFTMMPSTVEKEVIDNLEYLKMTFYKGNVFNENTTVIKNQSIVYSFYKEYVNLGKMPYWITHDDLFTLLDQVNEVCDANINVSHSIMEVIYSYISRLKDDPAKLFRYSDMDPDKFMNIPLEDYSVSTDSATARLLGAHLSKSMLSALNEEFTEDKMFEDLLAGRPMENV